LAQVYALKTCGLGRELTPFKRPPQKRAGENREHLKGNLRRRKTPLGEAQSNSLQGEKRGALRGEKKPRRVPREYPK